MSGSRLCSQIGFWRWSRCLSGGTWCRPDCHWGEVKLNITGVRSAYAREVRTTQTCQPDRGVVLARITRVIESQQDDARRILLGIDGVDGSGKTMFADTLARHLGAIGKHVMQVSLDNFHQPREFRYRRGRSSPEGFWLDSYDYQRLRGFVLEPLSDQGSGWFRPAGHDLGSDQPVEPPAQFAPSGSIVIVDGMFLNRDEVRNCWDYSVFLDVPFQVTAERMSVRDGSPADPSHPAMHRYVGGQKLYLAECDPAARATLVVDNTDPQKPTIISPEQTSYRRMTSR